MMRHLRAWACRLGALVGLGRRDAEFEEEIRSHIEMHAADNERAGLSPAEARRQAILAFGGVESVKEQVRDRRGVPIVESTRQDVRVALRGFRRNPGFAIAALVVLALGIGANTAIFTIVNGVLLKPLPYRDPGRLVMVWHTPPQASFPGIKRFAVSAANFIDWRRQQHGFERMGIVQYQPFALTGGGDPEHLDAARVSAGFFETLGAQPIAGRWFAADEDQLGRNHQVILSHRLWQSRFGGDAGVVGRTIRLDGNPYTVVGVMGPSFAFPRWAQAWTPMGWTEKERAMRSGHNCQVVARLGAGTDVEKAQAEMNTISRNLERQYPDDNKGWGAVVVPLIEQMVGDVRTSLLVLLGAVAFVLLVACANVANLVLARTLARRREMAVRLALGAGPARIVRHVLTETTILAIAGGALGLLVGRAAVTLLIAFFGDQLPKALPIEADGRVLAFTALVSVLTGIAAGLAPAYRLARASVGEAIKQGGSRADSDAAGGRVRGLLVVVEVALSLVLLVGAGLMIRTLWALNSVDSGFDARQVLTASITLAEAKYPRPEQRAQFFERLTERIRALPGVESAGVVTNLPMVSGNKWPVQIGGRPQAPISEQPQVQGNVITPGYLRALRIPVLRGRDISDTDRGDRPAVILVSESMAKWLWPGRNPIGERLTIGFFPDAVRQVVGVVKDVKEQGLTEVGTASMYIPLAQLPAPEGTIVLRTRTALPTALGPALTAAVHELDADMPVVDVRPMETVVSESTSDRRVTMYLLAGFALLALVLAAVGIYSVLAYAVRRRIREIGIRMALGAGGRSVLRMVVADAVKPTLVGVGLGLAGALALRNVMATLLFGVRPSDPLTLAAVSAVLLSVAVMASALPAYRATRVDPIVALRDE